MRLKLFLLTIFISAPIFAGGPRYKHKTPTTELEFQNIYHDIRGKHSFLTSNTSSQILVGQGEGVSPIWQNIGGIVQLTHGTTQAIVTTTSSTTWSDTELEASITPTSDLSDIIVIVSQSFYTRGNSTANVKLYRDAVELAIYMASYTNTDDATHFTGAGAAFTYVDSPATTSSVTYKTAVASSVDGTIVGTADGTNDFDHTIVLLEVLR